MSFKNSVIVLFVGATVLLSSCEPPTTNELLFDELLTMLEKSEPRYFDFTYVREDKLYGQIDRLSGLSFLKRNKDTYINNAYFKLNESEQINYLQILGHGGSDLNRLASQILDESAIYNLRDSINSPAMINPQWLAKVLKEAEEVEVIHNKDKAEVTFHLSTDKQQIQLHWLKDRKLLSALSINELRDGRTEVKHQWHFDYVSQSKYELLAAEHEEALKTQESMIL